MNDAAPALSLAWRQFRRMQDGCCLVAGLIYAGAAIHGWRVLPGPTQTKLIFTLAAPLIFLSLVVLLPLASAGLRRRLLTDPRLQTPRLTEESAAKRRESQPVAASAVRLAAGVLLPAGARVGEEDEDGGGAGEEEEGSSGSEGEGSAAAASRKMGRVET